MQREIEERAQQHSSGGRQAYPAKIGLGALSPEEQRAALAKQGSCRRIDDGVVEKHITRAPPQSFNVSPSMLEDIMYNCRI